MFISTKVGSSYAFLQRYYNYLYRIVAAIHSFNDIVHFSDVKTCSHPILLMHFLSGYFRTSVTWNEFLIEVAVFSEQHRLYWNESSHLKQLISCTKNFFRISSCLEQLLLRNNNSFVTNTFPDQLLLEDEYFSGYFSITATVTEEGFFSPESVIIQSMYFFEAGASCKQLLFQKKNFFSSRYTLKTVTFSDNSAYQFHSIYTWKDFPLTSINSFKYAMF